MTSGQLRQLQWIVPAPWAPELTAALSAWPVAGAKLSVRLHGVEQWLGFFDAQRIVEEALRTEAHALVTAHGCLPLAGCGRRGTATYFVEVSDSHMPLWVHREGSTARLSLGLLELWENALPEPRVQLRRRIPDKGPRRLAKTSATKVSDRAPSASVCPRTLPLFA